MSQIMTISSAHFTGSLIATCPDCGTVCVYWDDEDLTEDGHLLCSKCEDALTFFECDGCWENVSVRFSRSFHDKWDSGETISGEYCPSCRDTVDKGHPLPNMRAGYRRP